MLNKTAELNINEEGTVNLESYSGFESQFNFGITEYEIDTFYFLENLNKTHLSELIAFGEESVGMLNRVFSIVNYWIKLFPLSKQYRPPQEWFSYFAYLLGTIRHETGMKKEYLYTPVRETYYLPFGSQASLNYLHNQHYSGPRITVNGIDIPKDYGRGLIQVTHDYNYDKLTKRLNAVNPDEFYEDLKENPDLLLEDNYSRGAAIVGCYEGLFRGKKLKDYWNGSSFNWYEGRNIVNANYDKAQAIASYAIDFYNILRPMVKSGIPLAGEDDYGQLPNPYGYIPLDWENN
jgi:hypothetical protein